MKKKREEIPDGPTFEPLRERTPEELHEFLRTARGHKDFTYCLAAISDCEGYKGFGFKTLREYCKDPVKGLCLSARELAALFSAADFPGWDRGATGRVFRKLILEEGWKELVPFLPPSLVAELGVALKDPCRPKGEGEKVYNVNLISKGGHRPSYVVQRLAREAAHDERAKDLHRQIRDGLTTAHRAAIAMGWKKEIIQVPANVAKFAEKAAATFTVDECKEIAKRLLEHAGHEANRQGH